MSEDAPKVVLITPYTGGNLGDAAIQEAAIANIRRRRPHAEISLVTLDPQETSRIHGLYSFPISRRSRPAAVYDKTPGADKTGSSPGQLPADRSAGNEAVYKRLYVSVLPGFLRRGIWKARAWLTAVYLEARHIARAYRFLRGQDSLIVSGGGQLDDHWGGAWGHPYALCKWSTLARLSAVEVCVLSVGTSKLQSGLTRFFVARSLAAARYRSFRDRPSREKVAFVRTTRSDPVCPDLVFSYEYANPASRTGDGNVVAVSPITYLTQTSQSARSIRIYQRYVLDLSFFIENLVERGHDVLVFTSAAMDRPLASDIVDRVSARPLAGGRIRACYPDTPRDMLAALADVDLVVASRLHGILLSHVAKLPVLSITYDSKVTTYMTNMEMTEFMLDIADIDSDSLTRTFDRLSARSGELRHSLSQRIPAMASRLQEQYDVVFPASDASRHP